MSGNLTGLCLYIYSFLGRPLKRFFMLYFYTAPSLSPMCISFNIFCKLSLYRCLLLLVQKQNSLALSLSLSLSLFHTYAESGTSHYHIKSSLSTAHKITFQLSFFNSFFLSVRFFSLLSFYPHLYFVSLLVSMH